MQIDPTVERLLNNGNGLFNTHVQLEDVQNAIGEQMNTSARLGPNTKYTVVGDGNGFMSRVILVEADWTEVDETLPQKFILKCTSCMHVHGMAEKLKSEGSNMFTPEMEEEIMNHFEIEAQQLHNREVNLYEIYKTWNINDVLLAPKVYFSHKFSEHNKLKGFIGMEVVENAEIRHLYENIQPEELDAVLRALAVFQAKSLTLSKEQRQSITGFDFRTLMGKMMTDEGIQGMFKGIKKVNEEVLGERADRLSEYGTRLFFGDLICNLNEHNDIHQDVLVHGDLWSANILWAKKSDEFEVQKLIDYQLIHFGNPAEDICRMFLSTLSGDDCHNKWEELIEKFYGYFIDALEGKEAPYTLEQLKTSYKLYYPTAALVMLVMFGPVADMKLQYAGAEKTDELREILTNKADRMLHDVEAYFKFSEQFLAEHA